MKLTKTTDFAVRILVYLHQKEGLSTMNEIAENTNIAYNNLTKLIQKLSKSGIIYTKKGKFGGIRLLKKPKDISLKTIIDLIDGPTTLSECQKNPELCKLSHACKLKSVFHDLQSKIDTLFESVTLDQLC